MRGPAAAEYGSKSADEEQEEEGEEGEEGAGGG